MKEKRKNNIEVNDPMEYFRLPIEMQNKLLDWIEENLKERETYNHKYSSYKIKHLMPFYVTNGAFKGAMSVAGFKVYDYEKRNWIFNVEVREVAK